MCLGKLWRKPLEEVVRRALADAGEEARKTDDTWAMPVQN
jgi:hypothetical protein